MSAQQHVERPQRCARSDHALDRSCGRERHTRIDDAPSVEALFHEHRATRSKRNLDVRELLSGESLTHREPECSCLGAIVGEPCAQRVDTLGTLPPRR
jgi:hypothetical protein